jgi:hypothetical protein
MSEMGQKQKSSGMIGMSASASQTGRRSARSPCRLCADFVAEVGDFCREVPPCPLGTDSDHPVMGDWQRN